MWFIESGRQNGNGRESIGESYTGKTLNGKKNIRKSYRDIQQIYGRFMGRCRTQEDKNNLRLKYDFYD